MKPAPTCPRSGAPRQTSSKDRKRLLRTLIADVTVLPEPDQAKVWIGIRWRTGATDELSVARATHPGTARRSPSPAVAMVRWLAWSPLPPSWPRSSTPPGWSPGTGSTLHSPGWWQCLVSCCRPILPGGRLTTLVYLVPLQPGAMSAEARWATGREGGAFHRQAFRRGVPERQAGRSSGRQPAAGKLVSADVSHRRAVRWRRRFGRGCLGASA